MIAVTKPYLPNSEKYKAYIDDIYKRNWLTNNGLLAEELTQRLEDYLGVKNLLLVSNGTIALQIASHVLDIKKEILTSPFSFVATVSSQLWDGIDIKFSDINPQSLNMSPNEIEKSISSDTQAIMPVHVFGNPCEVEEIQHIANTNNLKIIYDAAHAFGVQYKGKSVLLQGDISTLSFHATKIFHTVEGGALIFKDKALYEKAKTLINFGYEKGNINHLGINAKMSEVHAAMGLCVLDEMDIILKQRKKIYLKYLECLSVVLQVQSILPETEQNYSYFPIVLADEKTLLKLLDILETQDIFPRRYFYPSLNQLPYIENSMAMPVSDDISQRILCLPIYPGLTDKEQEDIIEIILKFLQKEEK